MVYAMYVVLGLLHTTRSFLTETVHLTRNRCNLRLRTHPDIKSIQYQKSALLQINFQVTYVL